MKRFLRSTTALALSAALAVPYPAMAADPAAAGGSNDLARPLRTDESAGPELPADVQAAQDAQAKADKAARQAKRKERKKAEREAAQAGDDTRADTNATDQAGADEAARQTEGKRQKKSAQQATQDPQTLEQAAADKAERAERRERRKAEQKAERDRARADGNVLPGDDQAQADQAAELDARGRAVEAAVDGDASGEVTTRTIGQGDVRRSGEEYGPAAPAAGSNQDGISDLGKVVLFGLGALAVGKLLSSGDKVVSTSGDRLVVEGDEGYRVIKDDDALLRQPGAEMRTQTFADGSTRTLIIQPDGSRVETIRAVDGRVLRRTSILPDGRQFVLFDDTRATQPVQVSRLPRTERSSVRYDSSVSADNLRRAMLATRGERYERSFSLSQIRNIDAVRRLVPEIAVENVRFQSGSSVIQAEQARGLAALGGAIRNAIRENPGEVFLIEGHTDAIGSAEMNLTLSDRRAETVALALTEYYDVPPQNLVVQGYGEADLKIQTYAAEAANRRVAVRRITPLLN